MRHQRHRPQETPFVHLLEVPDACHVCHPASTLNLPAHVIRAFSVASGARAEELEVLVTGTPDLNFDELSKATEYDGGYGRDHPTIKAFWGAVENMPPEEQRRLLMFATGSKKVRGVCGFEVCLVTAFLF